MGRELIGAYHYTKGSSSWVVYRHGLFHVTNPLECLGVALWTTPIRAAALSVCDDPDKVLSLSRLIIVPDMPTNAASFMLSKSIALIRRDHRFDVLLTYADEGQGHLGGIYRATNWDYLGTVSGHPTWVDSTGKHVSQKAGSVNRNNGDMAALGYINQGIARKHKFVMRLA